MAKRNKDVYVMQIKILLSDDQKSMREGLRNILEKYDEFEVTAEADSTESTIALVGEHKPDVVVMDVGQPDLNSIEATNRIVAEVQDTKIIVLSLSLVRWHVMEMLKSGTSGYLLKNRVYEELVDAIREVIAGNTYLSTPVLAEVIREYVHKQLTEKTPVFSVLTPQEQEILQLIAEGRSTAQIAVSKGISTKTVETHRQHISSKLNIRGIANLTRYAIREGIADL
jgi:DNA-binding NarL/FixJ family response regulator